MIEILTKATLDEVLSEYINYTKAKKLNATLKGLNEWIESKVSDVNFIMIYNLLKDFLIPQMVSVKITYMYTTSYH